MRSTRLRALVVGALTAAALTGWAGPANALSEPPKPTADGPGAGAYRSLVDSAVVQVAGLLGVAPLASPPFVQPLQKKLSGGGQYAHTWDYGDPVDTCLIQLQPAAQKLGDPDLRFVLTHEVVHCYQDRETNGADVTDWVEEGAATWVGATLAPGSAIAAAKWEPYLEEPVKSLFFRAYDGVGFFAHLAHVGVDVAPRIVPMMKAPDDAAAFALAVAGSDAALDDWAAGLARAPELGASWATDGPDIPATMPPRLKKSIGDATTFSYALIKGGNAVFALSIDAEVVVVDAKAGTHGRLRDADGADRLVAALSGRPLCTLPEGCACPDGTAGAGVEFASLGSGPALLGVTGGATGTQFVVRGRPLDGFCAKPATMDPCLVGTWTGQGVQLSLPSVEISGVGGEGAVLRFAKDGTGSVDLDPSAAVVATLPGDLVGSFRMSGQAGGVVHATKGVMTTLTTSTSNLRMAIDVPPLLTNQEVPLGAADAQPFDGSYTCSKTTLEYSAPGFGGKSTWTRQ